MLHACLVSLSSVMRYLLIKQHLILIESHLAFDMRSITTIFNSRHPWDLTTLTGYEYKAFQVHALKLKTTVYYWPKMSFKDRPNIHIQLGFSDLTNVDCRISFLSPHLEGHGFLFKIVIQMCLLSTDKAIWMWVLYHIDCHRALDL